MENTNTTQSNSNQIPNQGMPQAMPQAMVQNNNQIPNMPGLQMTPEQQQLLLAQLQQSMMQQSTLNQVQANPSPVSPQNSQDLLEALPEERKINFLKSFLLITIMTAITAGVCYYLYQSYFLEGQSLIVQDEGEATIYEVVEVDAETIRKGQSNLDLQNLKANLKPGNEINQAEIEENDVSEEKNVKKLQR